MQSASPSKNRRPRARPFTLAAGFGYRLSRFLLLVLVTSSLQAASLTTIQLHNRAADEMIPIIQPMLASGEVITGQGYKLFLRASPETVRDVRQIIDALDLAPKMLLISVSQGTRREFEATRIDGNVSIESDNGRVEVGTDTENAAGSIGYSGDNAEVGISGSSRQGSENSKPVHRLRVAEGRQGFIETGSKIPYTSGYRDSTTEIVSATTGFYVLPRVNGNRVSLQVSPFKNAPVNNQSGVIETQQARTTVSGRLGEWLPIGGVSEQYQRSQSSIGSRSEAQGSRDDQIWIKAELLP